MDGIVMKEFSLEEYLKNTERKVVTRDGRPVRIICTDCKVAQPIIAIVNEGRPHMIITSFWKNGRHISNSTKNELDLFFAPEKHEGWININKWPDGVRDTDGIIYHNKLDIPDTPPVGGQRVATIKIEWEE